MSRKWITRIMLASSYLIVLSCPNPLTKAMVVNVKDQIVPVIVITSPAEGSLCANIVEITGKVTDAATEAGDDGSVRSLSYTIPGSTVAGSIAFGSDGNFSFQFSTVTLGTNFTISITAVDWNGNTGSASLPLQKQAGNGIPSLAVDPGNKQVTVTWSPVPHTVSYTLYYTTNGALPSEQVGVKLENAVSPCVLDDLTNGSVHVFQLKAVPEDGWPVSLSDYFKVIPLSVQTLCPRVTGELGMIRIEWDPITPTGECEVWRSTSKDGPYYNLSGPIESTQYLDRNVSPDTWYFYRVKPALPGSTVSSAIGSQTYPFRIRYPTVVGTCATPTRSYYLAVSGSYAYITNRGDGGLYVIDLSIPSSPRIVGSCTGTQFNGPVAASGSVVCIASGSSLLVIDASNPASPDPVGNCAIGNPIDVVAEGSYAYVLDGTDHCLLVVDISVPDSPTMVGTCDVPGNHIYVDGSFAYTVDGGLWVTDISDPTSPEVVGSCVGLAAYGVAVNGSYAYVSCGPVGSYMYGFCILDISDPANPTPVEGGNGGMCVIPGTANGVAAYGSYACMASGVAGLHVIDATDPANPLILSTVRIHGQALNVEVRSHYAFVAADDAGLYVIDISYPGFPVLVGTAATPGAAGVTIEGSYAYVAAATDGLQVIEISDRANPYVVHTYDSPGNAGRVAISGDYAFLADGEEGVEVIDLSDSGPPFLAATCDTPGLAIDVEIRGSYAFVADGPAGFQVIDISTPTSPSICGSLASQSYSFEVAIQGMFAYVTDWHSGLQVIDISNPLSPRLAGACNTDQAMGVAVKGSYAYVTEFYGGFDVIDISNPAQLQSELVDTPGPTGGIVVTGEYLYIVDADAGLLIYDISKPASPVLVATCPTTGDPLGIAVSGTCACVAGYGSGLQVIDLVP